MSRLKEIKENHEFRKGEGWELTILSEDIDWLIKQAERVEELECELSVVRRNYNFQSDRASKTLQENLRYKQALEKLVNAPNDMSRGRYADYADRIARDALKGAEPNDDQS